MEPYYQDGLRMIFLGDTLELLPKLPPESIDLVVTDPPWFVSSEVIIHRSMNPKKYKYRGPDIILDFGEWDHFENEEQYWEFTKAWFKETTRVLKTKGHLVTFFDQNKVSYLVDYADKLGMKMRQFLYWLKSNPVPRARKVDFMVALEQAVWFTKGTKSGATFNYRLGQQRNYIEAAIPGHTTREDGDRTHPTQKPVRVISKWIAYLSKPNAVILDPLMGSGTTLVAAKRLGRQAIGIEINEGYCQAAKERLERVPLTLDIE